MSVFSEKLIRLQLHSQSKNDLLDEMARMMFDAGVVDSLEKFRRAVFGREEIMSTGIGKGIALPHGRDNSVQEIKVACCLLAEPIDFDALDQEPVRIVFMIAVPQTGGKQYMKILSSISYFTREEKNRQAIISCQTPQELMEVLSEIEDAIQQDNPAAS